MMAQRAPGHHHLSSPCQGEEPLHSAGTILPLSPHHTSPVEGEARWSWGNTHRTNDIHSKERSHG